MEPLVYIGVGFVLLGGWIFVSHVFIEEFQSKVDDIRDGIRKIKKGEIMLCILAPPVIFIGACGLVFFLFVLFYNLGYWLINQLVPWLANLFINLTP